MCSEILVSRLVVIYWAQQGEGGFPSLLAHHLGVSSEKTLMLGGIRGRGEGDDRG